MLCWPGDTWAVLSLVPPPLPPDIPLQCLRHQVNGFMATLAWRESLQPIYPVNNFNQIHYPDKSVINCHILHAILFPKFVKESQTMGRVKNSVDSHQSSAQGERRGDRLSLWSPGSDWQTFVVAASDHNKCKNSFDHSSHFTGVTQCDHPPPPPWSVRSLRCPAEQDKRHREAGFTTPALDTREGQREARDLAT